MFQRMHIDQVDSTPVTKRANSFLAGFLIAILNPTLFLTWGSATSTIFSWFKSVQFIDMIVFPIAAGVGIVAWFGLLLKVLKKYREKIGEKFGLYAIRIAAVVMLGSGAYLLSQAGK